MSSLRRTLSSRANGALSRGPVTLEGKQRSAMNALSHGLLARTTLMRGEWSDGLEGLLDQYVDRLGPVDAVEYGYVEEMVAACWRLRRLWAIETRTLDNEADAQSAGDRLDRIAAAFAQLAEKPHPDLLHRYEMRMHLTYQRALHNLILLRTAGTNEPSPISGHSGDPKPAEAPEPPAGPASPSSPEGGRASAGAGLEPGSRLREESSRAAKILANCCSQQSEAAPPPVEQAVLPAVLPATLLDASHDPLRIDEQDGGSRPARCRSGARNERARHGGGRRNAGGGRHPSHEKVASIHRRFPFSVPGSPSARIGPSPHRPVCARSPARGIRGSPILGTPRRPYTKPLHSRYDGQFRSAGAPDPVPFQMPSDRHAVDALIERAPPLARLWWRHGARLKREYCSVLDPGFARYRRATRPAQCKGCQAWASCQGGCAAEHEMRGECLKGLWDQCG